MSGAETVAWTSGDGRAIEVVISLTVPASLAGNPRTAEQTPERTIDIEVTVDGAEVSHSGIEHISHPIVAAKIGTVGVKREQLDAIEQAIATLKASDEYKASEAMWSEWAQRQDKYDAETTAINNAMGE